MTRLSGGTMKPLLHNCATPFLDAALMGADSHSMRLIGSVLRSADSHVAYLVNAALLSVDSQAITGGEEFSKYKQQVVQMLAAEENILMPDGSRKATFTQETWDMVRPPACSQQEASGS